MTKNTHEIVIKKLFELDAILQKLHFYQIVSTKIK